MFYGWVANHFSVAIVRERPVILLCLMGIQHTLMWRHQSFVRIMVSCSTACLPIPCTSRSHLMWAFSNPRKSGTSANNQGTIVTAFAASGVYPIDTSKATTVKSAPYSLMKPRINTDGRESTYGEALQLRSWPFRHWKSRWMNRHK